MVLRLILGDQLNQQHSWFQDIDEEVCYFMAEMRQETDYVKHHIQKVTAFFLSMRNFSEGLKNQGFDVVYYTLDDPRNQQDLVKNLSQIIKEKNITRFEYQLPDEYRLDQQLKGFCDTIDIDTNAFDTEHFLTSRTDFENFFDGKKQYVMEYFYRYMRKRYDIMMLDSKNPEGGKWNFDQSNRKKWTGSPEIPNEKTYNHDVASIVSLIRDQGVQTIGNIDSKRFNWPISREESLDLLNYFCKHLLQFFGDYQDAMHEEQKFLFHSRLSFAMNSKMLSPKEVIGTVVTYWREHQDDINISQVEGFVRQILGWREYMRGMYWAKMPDYKGLNALDNHNTLPDFFWTADTKMNCVHHAIKQSLDEAYAHHIQRLMITGNYALLTQIHPDAVDEWYLGIYIDAIEWVEITNTRGMSQFADGGLVATKPYVSSGSYINKMSDYCKNCHYKVSKKVEEDACPFNALYWNFLNEKRAYFSSNQRMRMMLNLLDKMDKDQLMSLKKRANDIIQNADEY
ncbi:cryptochrome/photolyase family protein [Aquimarina spongiae]|uniref:Deoxyribodipyrimidine photolyase-related protein n=1 Tax=Aquimarina spongiae TaxID=570521 RepID=A0A1M6IY89_9FLAO|nr:cryptochrome/photolyase family protein [Aquimarina spongiae]SHJ39411.1 deoxyribodipyrimidine photolyase-related protein [Aquimarina spongiae]